MYFAFQRLREPSGDMFPRMYCAPKIHPDEEGFIFRGLP